MKKAKYQLVGTAITAALTIGVTAGVGAVLAKKGKMILNGDVASVTKYAKKRKQVKDLMKNTLKSSALSSVGTIAGAAIVKSYFDKRDPNSKVGYTTKKEIKDYKKLEKEYKNKETSDLLKKEAIKSSIRTAALGAATLGSAALTSAATMKLVNKGNNKGAYIVKELGKLGTQGLLVGTMASTVGIGRDVTATLLAKKDERRQNQKKG